MTSREVLVLHPPHLFLCGAAERVEDDTRGVGKRGLNRTYFCRNSNFGGARGPFTERPRELHSTQRRRWPRNLRLFLLPLSFSFFLSFSPFVLPLVRWLPAGREAPPSRGRGRAPAPSRFGSGATDGPHALRVARRSPLKRGRGRDLCGCDHTSVNAPDPIRTPQLSALGLE